MPEIPDVALEKTMSQLRMLQNFVLSQDVVDRIGKFKAFLTKTKTPDFETFISFAKDIDHVRNQLAHAAPPALPPKPAYSLDDEKDDDA